MGRASRIMVLAVSIRVNMELLGKVMWNTNQNSWWQIKMCKKLVKAICISFWNFSKNPEKFQCHLLFSTDILIISSLPTNINFYCWQKNMALEMYRIFLWFDRNLNFGWNSSWFRILTFILKMPSRYFDFTLVFEDVWSKMHYTTSFSFDDTTKY